MTDPAPTDPAPTDPASGPAFGDGFVAELAQLFAWRRDVRRFRTDALPEGELDGLLAIANGAPSVGLSQPWRFVTVDAPERRAAVRAEFERCNAAALALQGDKAGHYARLKLAGLAEAPCHLAVCLDPDPVQGHGLGRHVQPDTVAHSAVLAIHTLWLAARARGLGLGWVSILEPRTILSALDVPADWTLVAYLCLGWPAEESEVPELERECWERRRAAAVLRR